MKSKLILLTLGVITIAIGVLFAAPASNWSNGGWVITDSYKNPNPVEGSNVGTLSGTVDFLIGAESLPGSVSETIVVKAGRMVITKRWTSTEALSTKYEVSEVTGGTATFDAAGKLIYTIAAPNDGAAHSISFKLKPVGASWIAKLPIIRNYVLPKVRFDSSEV